MLNNKRGQSTVEYILLVTAVVVVMVLFLLNNNAPFQNKLNSTLKSVTTDIGTMGTRLDAAHAPAPKDSSGSENKSGINTKVNLHQTTMPDRETLPVSNP